MRLLFTVILVVLTAACDREVNLGEVPLTPQPEQPVSELGGFDSAEEFRKLSPRVRRALAESGLKVHKDGSPPALEGTYQGSGKVTQSSSAVVGHVHDIYLQLCSQSEDGEIDFTAEGNLGDRVWKRAFVTGSQRAFTIWREYAQHMSAGGAATLYRGVEIWSGEKKANGDLELELLNVVIDAPAKIDLGDGQGPRKSQMDPGAWWLFGISLRRETGSPCPRETSLGGGIHTFRYAGYHTSPPGGGTNVETVLRINVRPQRRGKPSFQCAKERDGDRYVTLYVAGSAAGTYPHHSGDLASLPAGAFKAVLTDWPKGTNDETLVVAGTLTLLDPSSAGTLEAMLVVAFQGENQRTFAGFSQTTACSFVP